MLRANINGMRFDLAWLSARLRGFRRRLPLVVLIAPLLFVCGVVFGLSAWLLPDQVANIAELVSGGLSVAALAAGLRAPGTAPDKPVVE